MPATSAPDLGRSRGRRARRGRRRRRRRRLGERALRHRVGRDLGRQPAVDAELRRDPRASRRVTASAPPWRSRDLGTAPTAIWRSACPTRTSVAVADCRRGARALRVCGRRPVARQPAVDQNSGASSRPSRRVIASARRWRSPTSATARRAISRSACPTRTSVPSRTRGRRCALRVAVGLRRPATSCGRRTPRASSTASRRATASERRCDTEYGSGGDAGYRPCGAGGRSSGLPHGGALSTCCFPARRRAEPLDRRRDVGRRQRAGEQVALRLVAAELAQAVAAGRPSRRPRRSTAGRGWRRGRRRRRRCARPRGRCRGPARTTGRSSRSVSGRRRRWVSEA